MDTYELIQKTAEFVKQQENPTRRFLVSYVGQDSNGQQVFGQFDLDVHGQGMTYEYLSKNANTVKQSNNLNWIVVLAFSEYDR